MTEDARQSEDLPQQVIRATPDAVVVAGRDGAIKLWNQGGQRIFGYSAQDALGQSLDLIIPERLRARHWDGYRQVMETGETRYGGAELLAVPAMRKDGESISIEFSIALLRDEAGRVKGAAAVIRDVTKRWQEQKALQKRLAELEARL